MTQIKPSYRRPFTALGHALLALFSLGYLGVTGRSCAIYRCTPKLAFLVATGTVSSIFALLVAILQLVGLHSLVLFVWSIDVALLLWWCVAVTLTILLVDSTPTPLTQPIFAFAWVCITFALLLTVTSIAYAPCTQHCLGPDAAPAPSDPAQSGSSNDTTRNDGGLPNERDYVPEDRYMGPARGDLDNYDATNLVGRPA